MLLVICRFCISPHSIAAGSAWQECTPTPHPPILFNHRPGRAKRQAATDERVSRFWVRYREAPIKQAVKPPEDRWYGVWIERFIEVANGRKLAAPRAEEVEAQLRDLGAFGDVLSRQFRQAVGAIQILIFRALDVPGAGPWTGASGRVV